MSEPVLSAADLRRVLLRGPRVYLRPVEVADATDRYAGWLRDPETTRFLESGGRDESPASVAAYIRAFEGRNDVLFLAIRLADGDTHVGNIKLEPINWRHRHAVLGIMIGEASARGRGIGSEAMVLVLRHAFTALALHRVSLGVIADNLAAIRCYERLGFVTEGRARECVRRPHGFVDGLTMGILAHEFFARYGR